MSNQINNDEVGIPAHHNPCARKISLFKAIPEVS
jgi:hypothetical protein